MVTTTGRSLKALDSRTLYSACYGLMCQQALRTKEEQDVLDSLDKQFRDHQYEKTTGMPAISQWVKPANELDLPNGS